MNIHSREDFDKIAIPEAAPLPVQLGDGRLGMCNHWDDAGVQVDAYRGNEHECLLVPYVNFFHLGNGALFATINKAVRSLSTDRLSLDQAALGNAPAVGLVQ